MHAGSPRPSARLHILHCGSLLGRHGLDTAGRLPPMNPQTTARQLAIGRIVIGGALAVLPGRAGGGWLGELAQQPVTALAVRSLGARDMAIGAGLMRALDTGATARPWLLASAASDAADAIGTVIAWKHLPGRGRILTLVLASGATAVGLRLMGQLAD